MRGDSFGENYQKIDYGLMKRLLQFLKPYKNYVIGAIVITILVSALGPIKPYIIKIAIDENIAKSDTQSLMNTIFLFIGILLFHGLLRFGLTYLMQWVGQNVLYDIRMKVFEKIQKLSMRYYDKNPVGRLVTRVTNDIEALNQLFSSGLVTILADLLLIIWIAGFMFFINWKLALVTMLILPLLIWVTAIFRVKVRVIFRDIRKEVARMNSFLNEFISGIKTVKLFTQEEEQHKKFDDVNNKTKELFIDTVFWYSLFFPAIEFIAALGLALVLWYSAGTILQGFMTVGTLIAFIQYAEMFFRPVREISEKYTTLQSAMASAERIYNILDEEDIVPNFIDNAIDKTHIQKIIFKDLSFSYDGKKEVLKNVNFEVNQGEKVAIVGATGSGKTTIINLLTGFYQYEKGNIFVNGIDLKDINFEHFRRKIALVMQDVFLFSRSIEDNISLGNEKISKLNIEQAAKALGAYEFIMQLNDSFSKVLEERGATLSSGQRQLISFCRAYASNPELLILDEATSNIDSETEHLIEKSLHKLLENRTSIIIAHRLSTIKRADKIVVLHKGEIREIGNHNELLERNGFYAKLYNLQYSEAV